MPTIEKIREQHVSYADGTQLSVGDQVHVENWLALTTTPVTITGFGTYAHCFVALTATGEQIDEAFPVEFLVREADPRLTPSPTAIPLG